MTDDELKRLLDANAERIEKRFDVLDGKATELHHLFAATAEDFRDKFNLLAEGIANVDEKLDRKTADIENRLQLGFAETQAMIKFSHADLDRRIRTLEDNFASMQVRIERLEETKTTH